MSANTSALPPTVDDTAIWDIWLSQFHLPISNVAVEIVPAAIQICLRMDS